MNLALNSKLQLFLGIVLGCLMEMNVTAAAAVGESRSEIDELYDLFGKEFVELELKRLELTRTHILAHIQVDKYGNPTQYFSGDMKSITPIIAKYVKKYQTYESPKQTIFEASKKDACDFVQEELKINVPDCQDKICEFKGITCDNNRFVTEFQVKYIETDMKI